MTWRRGLLMGLMAMVVAGATYGSLFFLQQQDVGQWQGQIIPGCGDGICDIPFENASNCPEDCGIGGSCGNGSCEPPSESSLNCSTDCFCGDGVCENLEMMSCSQDCGGNDVSSSSSGGSSSGGSAFSSSSRGGSTCGNGVTESGEECDDGNTTNGDGCSDQCQDEGGGNCGNGQVESGESCDGGACCNANCTYKSSTTTCRAAAGACDEPELCSGSSASCPSDAFKSAGSECRAASGACDVAETCPGTSAACPSNDFAAAGTECRSAVGACDIRENCTGTSNQCPADTFKANIVVCRPSIGACDQDEKCPGNGPQCPTDVFASGNECRPSSAVCDPAEQCSGQTAQCPADINTCVQSSSSVSSTPSSASSAMSQESSISQYSSASSTVMISSVCGNGRRDYNEECDDGNPRNGDGCSDTCRVEDGYRCRPGGQLFSRAHTWAYAMKPSPFPMAPWAAQLLMGGCKDSDGGIIPATRGMIGLGEIMYATDECIDTDGDGNDDSVLERYCKDYVDGGEESIGTVMFNCSSGLCQSDACRTAGGGGISASSCHIESMQDIAAEQCDMPLPGGLCESAFYTDVIFQTPFVSPPHVLVTPSRISDGSVATCTADGTDKILCRAQDTSEKGFRLVCYGSPETSSCGLDAEKFSPARVSWIAIDTDSKCAATSGHGTIPSDCPDLRSGLCRGIFSTHIEFAKPFGTVPHVLVAPEEISTQSECVAGATDQVLCFPDAIKRDGFSLLCNGSPNGTCGDGAMLSSLAKAGWLAMEETSSCAIESAHGVGTVECAGPIENGVCEGGFRAAITFEHPFTSPPHVILAPEMVSSGEISPCAQNMTDEVVCRAEDVTADGFIAFCNGSPKGEECGADRDAWATSALFGYLAIARDCSSPSASDAASSTSQVTVTQPSPTEGPDVCEPICGDGKVVGNEVCDDGNSSNADACLLSCQRASCGDTFVFIEVEECDDGNTVSGDGCSSMCVREKEAQASSMRAAAQASSAVAIAVPDCSDRIDNDGDDLVDYPKDSECESLQDWSEAPQCSDKEENDSDGLLDLADPDCEGPSDPSEFPQCSDMVENDIDGLVDLADPDCEGPTDPSEFPECNDKSDNDGDNAIDLQDPDCATINDDDERSTLIALSTCGNSLLETGEECDEGPNNSDEQPNACRIICRLSRCGDRVRDAGEECDDGNGFDHDGCSGACRNEAKVAALPQCGNGVIEAQEECDDGPRNSNKPGFSCLTSCIRNRCGDGIRGAQEQCDDGNRTAGDGCAECQEEKKPAPPNVEPPPTPPPTPLIAQLVPPMVQYVWPIVYAPVAPRGDTGPAAVIAMAGGAAAGMAWVRRRRRSF